MSSLPCDPDHGPTRDAQLLSLRYLAGSAVFVAVAVLGGGIAWLLLWPALSLALVGWSHANGRVGFFGKRSDGGIRVISLLLLGPYLAFVWGFSHFKRRLLGQNAHHRIAPGLFLGRRPTGDDLPEGIRTVVDLTCEFAEPRVARRAELYLCLPTLNRWIAPTGDVRDLLERLRTAPEPIYVHCGAGKGRSTLVLAALLVDRGVAPDADSAFEAIRVIRPFVSLHEVQWRQLRELTRKAREPSPSAARLPQPRRQLLQ